MFQSLTLRVSTPGMVVTASVIMKVTRGKKKPIFETLRLSFGYPRISFGLQRAMFRPFPYTWNGWTAEFSVRFAELSLWNCLQSIRMTIASDF
jgi:hypothetical protein